MTLGEKLRQELSVDGSVVTDDPAVLKAHSGDKWFAAEIPDTVVFGREQAASFCLARKNSGDGTRGRVRLRRRVCAGTQRRRAFLEADEQDQGSELLRRHCHR